jgi:[ribosomal protein S5]-alanine N-acetyltransferase
MTYSDLSSDRLRFVPWTLDFAPAWTFFFTEKSATEFLGMDTDLSPEAAAEFWINKQLDRYAKKAFGHLALFDWQEEKLVGSAGLLLRQIDGIDFVEVAYSVLPHQWGKGYAGEAAKLLRRYAEHRWKNVKLISIIHKDNLASQQVAKKIGFEKLWERNEFGMPVYIYGSKDLASIIELQPQYSE